MAIMTSHRDEVCPNSFPSLNPSRPRGYRRVSSAGSVGTASSSLPLHRPLGTPPPNELIRLLPIDKHRSPRTKHNAVIARCVLGVPDHSLHCYPVASPPPSNSSRQKNVASGDDSDGGLVTLRLMPHLRRRQNRKGIFRCTSFNSLVRIVSCIAVSIFLIVTTRNFSKPMMHSYVADYQHLFVPNINDPDRAIFLISMGRQAAESKIVERFLMSTRRRGHWNGHVVLLTDAPVDRYRALENRDEHFIVMNPRPEHFNWETKHDMPYKRFKTYVLDYVDSDPRLDSVRLVYYLDVDIIVGNTLSNFFHDVERDYNISSRTGSETMLRSPDHEDEDVDESNIYFFKGNFAKTPVQGGQIILERDSSRNCLLWWRSFMDQRLNETKDQPFLKEMMENNHNNTRNCHMTVMTQEPHLYFPYKDSVKEMNLRRKSERVYSTLIHIKNTGKVRDIPEEDETAYITDVLYLPLHDSSHLDVGKKMHFDPDEPPWSPNFTNSSEWSPTYFSVKDEHHIRQGPGSDEWTPSRRLR